MGGCSHPPISSSPAGRTRPPAAGAPASAPCGRCTSSSCTPRVNVLPQAWRWGCSTPEGKHNPVQCKTVPTEAHKCAFDEQRTGRATDPLAMVWAGHLWRPLIPMARVPCTAHLDDVPLSRPGPRCEELPRVGGALAMHEADVAEADLKPSESAEPSEPSERRSHQSGILPDSTGRRVGGALAMHEADVPEADLQPSTRCQTGHSAMDHLALISGSYPSSCESQ